MNNGMRFMEKEIPTRFDMEHMDRDSSLAYSMDPAVRPFTQFNNPLDQEAERGQLCQQGEPQGAGQRPPAAHPYWQQLL